MKYPKKSAAVALFTAAVLAFTPAFAAEKSRQKKAAAKPAPVAEAPEAPAGEGGQAAYGVKIGKFFSDEQKEAARRAFAPLAKAKECLPGMQKKTATSGCDSPWDTRYWAVGQSLQPAVTSYPVPAPVASKLPPVPKGYEYVRVADDILLISTGNKLVVDMIENLSG